MNDQELYRYAKTIIPGGTGLFSKRSELMAPELFPAYFKTAKGCRLTTIDDKEYLDFTSCGIGACLLGFNDDDVTEAVIKVIRDGNFSTLNPPEEVALAERLCAIHPWASAVRFARGGGDIGGVAARVARAATGKSKIIIIGYHGAQDWYLASNLLGRDALRGLWLTGLDPAGVPKELTGTAIPCMHGDSEMFNDLLKIHGNDLAAVFVEPMRHEYPEPGFLEALRAGCDKYGALLVYDEITIGWRHCFGGSHRVLNVNPDMAIFSKAMGNGHPIAAVIGNQKAAEGMHKAFLSSTYWTERTGPVAALATIKKMEENRVWEKVTAFGDKVMKLWKNTADEVGLPLNITSELGCLACFGFGNPYDPEKSSANVPNLLKTLFTQLMLERGIMASGGFYPTLAHGDNEFAIYSAAVKEVFTEMADLAEAGETALNSALRGPLSNSGFGRLVK